MVNFQATFHGNLPLEEAIGASAGDISQLQRFSSNIYVCTSYSIPDVQHTSIPISFVFWAPSLNDLLLENTLCTVHGRFVMRSGDPNMVMKSSASMEISAFMCHS